MTLLKETNKRSELGRSCMLLLTMLLLGLWSSRTDTTKTVHIPVVENKVPEDSEDLKCLIKTLWFESRGEGDKGMKLVAEVIINRTKHKAFPNTICGVIKERSAFHVTSKKLHRKIPTWWYRHIKKIALRSIQDGTKTLPDNILWYKVCSADSSFFNTRKLHLRYKNHCFFK